MEYSELPRDVDGMIQGRYRVVFTGSDSVEGVEGRPVEGFELQRLWGAMGHAMEIYPWPDGDQLPRDARGLPIGEYSVGWPPGFRKDERIPSPGPVSGALVDRAMALGAVVTPWDPDAPQPIDEFDEGAPVSAEEAMRREVRQLPDDDLLAILQTAGEDLGEQMPAWSPDEPREALEAVLVKALLIRTDQEEEEARDGDPDEGDPEELDGALDDGEDGEPVAADTGPTDAQAEPEPAAEEPAEAQAAVSETEPAPAEAPTPGPSPADQARSLMVGRQLDELDRKALRALVREYELDSQVDLRSSADDIRASIRQLASEPP